jgi:hypothetical protein
MKRLIEEGGTQREVDLLRAAHGESPPDGSLRRTLTALGVGTATLSSGSTAVSAAAAGAKASTSFLAAKWIGIGIAGGAVALGAVGGVERYTASAERPPAAVATVAPPLRPVGPQAAAPAQQEEVARAAESPVVGDVPAAPPAAAARTERPVATEVPHPAVDTESTPAVSPVSAPLAPEIAAIDSARRAVGANRPTEALGILDRYAADFPRGRFVPEATYLRIQALFQRGDQRAASDLGRRYLASMPDGPHAKHVRAMIAASGETIP